MKRQFFFCLATIGMVAVYTFAGCKGNGSKDAKADSTASAATITRDAMLDSIHICTEMLPPSMSGYLTTIPDTVVSKRSNNKNDTFINNNIQSFNEKQEAPMKSAIWNPYLWHYNVLKVSFIDGDPVVQQKVKSTAKEWEHYCGIRFDFGNFTNPDISISFSYRGSWSYIGNYSKQVSPSMNLGWLTPDTDQEEYNRVVLHEFGHAIGFIHEHSNPENNPIEWNKSAVYEYYGAPPNKWSHGQVDTNIFQKYNRAELNFTSFDPTSIMLYAFPATLTLNGYSTRSNNSLSINDKSLAARNYPVN